MKKTGKRLVHLCLLSLLLFPILTACRIDFSGKEEFAMKAFQAKSEQVTQNAKPEEEKVEKDEETESTDKSEPMPSMEEPAYTINGKVTLEGDFLHVQGTTTLPPGTVVSVRMRRYPNGTQLEEIKEYRVEPSSIVDAKEAMEVMEDGTFDSYEKLKRPDFPFRYRLELYFIPDRAEKAVQDNLITGEGNIENLPGMIPIDTFTKNPHLQRIVPGYMKYGNILKQDEDGGDNTVVELNPVKNIQ
jgi:hypothetical protein